MQGETHRLERKAAQKSEEDHAKYNGFGKAELASADTWYNWCFLCRLKDSGDTEMKPKLNN